jgi:TonB family protein
MLLATAFLLAASILAVSAQEQQPPPQLTLADILIGLRSKKLTLPERNKILTDAVVQRGITFALSKEIEIELEATGADTGLMDAIKKKSTIVKTSAVVQPVETKPAVVTPPSPPEYAVFLQRGDSSFARGELDAAVVEYGKVIELNPSLADAYLSRGRVYSNKGWYDLAIADFTKAAELDPKDSTIYGNRGQAWEKKGDIAKAKVDYAKALELNADNAIAKTNLERIKADEAKSQPMPALAKPATTTPVKQPDTAAAAANNSATGSAAPESIDLGSLSAVNAVRLVKPIYSPLAVKSNITGRVTVRVTIDEEGNVTSAKAIDGHQLLRQSSEDAARKSKFKPAMHDGKPIKATGVITYNYSPAGGTQE